MKKYLALAIYSLNGLMLFLLVKAYINGNDKAILLLIVGLPFLILSNFIVGLTLSLFKSEYKSIFYKSAIGITMLFIPILIVVPFFLVVPFCR